MCVSVLFVCVCVCEREREREAQTNKNKKFPPQLFLISVFRVLALINTNFVLYFFGSKRKILF